ncbi:MAG: hypothetical protein QXU89_04260, partial [Desulfurococcaceae archaeon]
MDERDIKELEKMKMDASKQSILEVIREYLKKKGWKFEERKEQKPIIRAEITFGGEEELKESERAITEKQRITIEKGKLGVVKVYIVKAEEGKVIMYVKPYYTISPAIRQALLFRGFGYGYNPQLGYVMIKKMTVDEAKAELENLEDKCRFVHAEVYVICVNTEIPGKCDEAYQDAEFV